MKYSAWTGILLLMAVLVAFLSCNKFDDLNDAKAGPYESEFALPLFSGKTTIREALEDFGGNDYVSIGPDGLITLSFKGDLAGKKAIEIWDVYDTVPFFFKDSIFALPLQAPGQLDIDLVRYTDGYISAYMESEHKQDVQVRFFIPDLRKNGKPFEKTVNLKYTGGGTTSGGFLFESIAGYELLPSNDTAYIRYEAVRADGKHDTLKLVAGALTSLKFGYIQGYWGKELVDMPRDTIDITFFNHWTQGTIYFQNPTIKVNLENSFGVPTRSYTRLLRIFTVRGQQLDLESPFIYKGIDFDYPRLNEVGKTKVMSFAFDNSNSNIADVLGAGPTAVDYDLDFYANPDSNVNIKGFMTDSSYFKFQVEVILPFYGKASGFEARDTFDLNFKGYDEVDYVEFKLVTDNGTPLGTSLQGYFMDDKGARIDSLFDGVRPVLAPAPVNNNGLVTGRVSLTSYARFDAARFQRVRAAKKIIMTSFFSTTNNGTVPVKVTADQDISMRMGMKVGLKKQ